MRISYSNRKMEILMNVVFKFRQILIKGKRIKKLKKDPNFIVFLFSIKQQDQILRKRIAEIHLKIY